MKTIFLKTAVIFTLLILFSSCASHNNAQVFQITREKSCEEYRSLTRLQINTSLDLDIYRLQESVESGLVYREKSLHMLSQANKEFLQDEKPVSPATLNQLNATIQEHVTIIKPMLKVLSENKCWIRDGQYTNNSKIELKGKVLFFATLMYLYDDYSSILSIVNENEKFRRYVNKGDKGYDRNDYLLETLTNRFLDEDLTNTVINLNNYYSKNKKKIKNYAKKDENFNYLTKIIENSKSYKVVLNLNKNTLSSSRSNMQGHKNSDLLYEIRNDSINSISETFSNAVGSYEERKGLLYEDENVHKDLINKLKIGDILLEKTPFRLTDSMIPGHWGHAAIWIGTKEELIELGLWNHPLIKPYHKQIQEHKLVAESLRTGTTLSSLSHFMNVDDVAILREKKSHTKKEIEEIILLTLRQIGKEYDFNFDVETTDKIVCSQLVYISYSHIDWPTESVVGRYTISPDNIAIKTLDNGAFKLVVFYHEGKLVKRNPLKSMQKLMHIK